MSESVLDIALLRRDTHLAEAKRLEEFIRLYRELDSGQHPAPPVSVRSNGAFHQDGAVVPTAHRDGHAEYGDSQAELLKNEERHVQSRAWTPPSNAL